MKADFVYSFSWSKFSRVSFSFLAGFTNVKCNINSIIGKVTMSSNDNKYIGTNTINVRIFILKTTDTDVIPSFS